MKIGIDVSDVTEAGRLRKLADYSRRVPKRPEMHAQILGFAVDGWHIDLRDAVNADMSR